MINAFSVETLGSKEHIQIAALIRQRSCAGWSGRWLHTLWNKPSWDAAIYRQQLKVLEWCSFSCCLVHLRFTSPPTIFQLCRAVAILFSYSDNVHHGNDVGPILTLIRLLFRLIYAVPAWPNIRLYQRRLCYINKHFTNKIKQGLPTWPLTQWSRYQSHFVGLQLDLR